MCHLLGAQLFLGSLPGFLRSGQGRGGGSTTFLASCPPPRAPTPLEEPLELPAPASLPRPFPPPPPGTHSH